MPESVPLPIFLASFSVSVKKSATACLVLSVYARPHVVCFVGVGQAIMKSLICVRCPDVLMPPAVTERVSLYGLPPGAVIALRGRAPLVDETLDIITLALEIRYEEPGAHVVRGPDYRLIALLDHHLEVLFGEGQVVGFRLAH
jgi:hypothetical protein